MEQKNSSKTVRVRKQRRDRGFTLLELAIATLVLMVGIVGVVQLVPASIQSNLNNRVDTTAMVFAQREMDQIIDQPLTSSTFTDADGRAINLGSTTVTNTVFGGPAIMQGTVATIDFTATPVASYNYSFTDANDPTGASYQMRWAVISNITGGVVVSKRFIVGCLRNGGTQFRSPAIVDTLVQK
jgi:Tfp pilus assembly protein PilV